VLLEASAEGRTLRVEVGGRDGRYTVSVDGRTLEVDLAESGDGFSSLLVDGHCYEVGVLPRPGGFEVTLGARSVAVEVGAAAAGAAARVSRHGAGPLRVAAPMPGKIVRVLVVPDQEVAAGDGLVVIEAMKMENELRASRSGRVSEVAAREGQAVESGALLVVVE
jgi:biotin carboxyl carrier protein